MPSLHDLLPAIIIGFFVLCGAVPLAVGLYVKPKPEPVATDGKDDARGMTALALVAIAIGVFVYLSRSLG